MDYTALVSRWFHVGGAIILVGGGAFLRFVLAPVAETLPEPEHLALRQGIMARWRRFVHPLVGVLFLSGCLNFWLRLESGMPSTWHALAGFHLLLGLYVLFIASALVGRSAGLANLRANWKHWLLVNVAVAFVAVMLSGAARFILPKAVEAAKVPTPASR